MQLRVINCRTSLVKHLLLTNNSPRTPPLPAMLRRSKTMSNLLSPLEAMRGQTKLSKKKMVFNLMVEKMSPLHNQRCKLRSMKATLHPSQQLKPKTLNKNKLNKIIHN